MARQEKQLHTPIPLGDFKSLSGVGDREDKTGQFCDEYGVCASLSLTKNFYTNLGR
jgi:hypothetical protein